MVTAGVICVALACALSVLGTELCLRDKRGTDALAALASALLVVGFLVIVVWLVLMIAALAQ